MCRTAIILAGGRGERLKNHTISLPKPLLPIGSTPLLKWILDQLAKYEYKRVILATYYKSELIQEYCGTGASWNLSIEYTKEEKPLGTIGPLKLISSLPENFLVMNADVITDLDLAQFYESHVEERRLFTIATTLRLETLQYGVLQTEQGRLISFEEKPTFEHRINMGIYMAHQKILSYIPDNTFFHLTDLLHVLLNAKQPISVLHHSGTWLDIGTPLHYQEAQKLAIS